LRELLEYVQDTIDRIKPELWWKGEPRHWFECPSCEATRDARFTCGCTDPLLRNDPLNEFYRCNACGATDNVNDLEENEVGGGYVCNNCGKVI